MDLFKRLRPRIPADWNAVFLKGFEVFFHYCPV
jgi:hypothetical protein